MGHWIWRMRGALPPLSTAEMTSQREREREKREKRERREKEKRKRKTRKRKFFSVSWIFKILFPGCYMIPPLRER